MLFYGVITSGLLTKAFTNFIKPMAHSEGITETLKAENPMKWVGLMNNIKASAEEILLDEIVFA